MAQKAPKSPRDLKKSIEKLLEEDRYENATWGIHIVDLSSGQTLYKHNERKSFMPASNMKLYTTAAALDQLGPDFTYETQLYAFGSVIDSVLQGDLVVRGSGDPTIGGRAALDFVLSDSLGDGDATEVFRNWADSLRAHGITRIAGDIVGDDDVFDDLPLGVGWNWDDEVFWYAGEMGGLVFNDNLVEVTIEGTLPGRPGRVTWGPDQTDYVDIINATMTIPADSSLDEGYDRERASNVIKLSSRVPAGSDDTESLSVTNGTKYFVHVLRSTLVEEGVVVDGRALDIDDGWTGPDYTRTDTRIVARYASPPMSEIVRGINKPSHNLWAEQVLKTLGHQAPPDSMNGAPLPRIGTTRRGAKAAMATFAAAKIDTSRFRMRDGSGLSRLDLITPEMTTRLLSFMWAHPDTAVTGSYYRSLPIAGVDGTIESLIREGPAIGNLRAKTGTLTGVRSLSGYIMSSAGTPLAFSVMCNNYTVKTSEINDFQRTFADLLARYRR